MFPLSVVGRDEKLPKATIALIVVNILVFLWELSVDAKGDGFLKAALQNYGLEVCKIGEQSFGSTALDALRSLFLHASIAHVLGNMWFLFLFGKHVERYLGPLKFVAAYLSFGLVATIAHVIFGNIICTVSDTGVVIGASGAVAGVMGGFLYLRPDAKVKTLLGFFRPFVWSVNLPAFLFLGYWLLMDILQQVGWIGVETDVAHWAHIGGFFAGFALLFCAGFFKPVPKRDPLEHLAE